MTTDSGASGAASVDPTKKPADFKKTTSFFYNNRQAIVNTIGVAFVFYFAVHNHRVHLAWNQREEEVKAMQQELDTLKALITDDAWVNEADGRIKNGESNLKRELRIRLTGKDNEGFVVSDTKDGGGDGLL
jgi:hypothetical protein